MDDEIERLRTDYRRMIEDGRRIEVFTSIPEWQWYVESVIRPTIEDYTNRIMSGQLKTDKEDWIMRGMVMGMKLLIETTESFKIQVDTAKEKSNELEEHIKNESR